MKIAQVLHSWRRVSDEWESDFEFSKLEVQTARGFKASEVGLSGGVCILAGVNSGGKSRLIRSIHNEFSLGLESFTKVTWKSGPPPTAVFVDFFELLIRQAKMFDVVDLEDLVDSSGLTPMSLRKQRDVKWVLGRNYANVEIAELENSVDGDSIALGGRFRPDVVPYFRVTHESGEVFSSVDLSRGELAVLTLSWVLDSLKSDELYLFDEPDLMLSPQSSQRAIDLLVSGISRMKCPAFIATHSYHTLASVPEDLLVHVNVVTDGLSVASRPDDAALWKTLKVAAPVKVIFVVEDDAARDLLKMLLPLISSRHHDLSGIWIAGDASKVVRAGSFPESRGQTLEIWGVLDGNEEDRYVRDNILRLPGGRSPEVGALDILRDSPHVFDVDERRVEELFARHAAGDPHDNARDIAEALGFHHLTFLVQAWRWWATQDGDGKVAFAEFKEDVLLKIPLE